MSKKSNRKLDQLQSTDHVLLSVPPHAKKIYGGKWQLTLKTKNQQFTCKYVGCSNKTRNYCKCNPGYRICRAYHPVHIACEIIIESESDWIQYLISFTWSSISRTIIWYITSNYQTTFRLLFLKLQYNLLVYRFFFTFLKHRILVNKVQYCTVTLFLKKNTNHTKSSKRKKSSKVPNFLLRQVRMKSLLDLYSFIYIFILLSILFCHCCDLLFFLWHKC